MCKAIIKEKKRLAVDAKQTSKLTTPEDLATELIRAATKDNIVTVKRLLKQRKKVPFDVNFSTTKFKVYGQHDHNRSIHLRSGEGADFTNALMMACEYSFIGIVNRLLMEKDIDINKQFNENNNNGETALFAACQSNNLQIVNRLLQEKAIDINLATNFITTEQGRPGFFGINPLLMASYMGHVRVVDRLLQEKGTININQSTEHGIDALMMACQQGHSKVVKRLLREIDTIEDINRQSEAGTALSIAKQFRHKAIVRMLKSAGATQ